MRLTDNDWVEDHLKQQDDRRNLPEAKAWFRSRPHCVQEQMKLFPPHCVVKLTKEGCCDDAYVGRCMAVSVYYEHGEVLGCVDGPGGSMHKVPIDCVKVIGYYNGMTPEFMEQVLKEE